MPEHRPLTGRTVHHDIRRLVRTIQPLTHVRDIDTGSSQALHLNAPPLVVAHCSDVFRPQSQTRTRNHGRRNLAADGIELARKRYLAARRGKLLHSEHGVGRIQPDADYIETRVEITHRPFSSAKDVSESSPWRCAAVSPRQ